MTRYIDIRVGVNDDEFTNFLNKLASSVASISARDEDGDEISLTPTGDLDSTGVPWLESVHAKTKTQTQDKRWKRAKGISEEQRDAAETAWRSANAAGQTQVAGVQQAAPVQVPGVATQAAPVAGVAIPSTAPVQQQQAAPASIPGLSIPGLAPAPTMPVVEPDIPASLDDVAKAFESLQATIVAKGGQVTAEFVGQIYQAANVIDPQDMTNNETARRSVIKTINATIAQFNTPT